MSRKKLKDAPGLATDPAVFKLFTEISIINNIGDREFERVMPGGLTLAQFAVINHLIRRESEETIGEIAAAMIVSQPSMSSTVKKLEEKKFVELVPDTEDRRVKRVRVTKAGRAMREKAVKAIGPSLAQLKTNLPEMRWEDMLTALTSLRTVMDSMR